MRIKIDIVCVHNSEHRIPYYFLSIQCFDLTDWDSEVLSFQNAFNTCYNLVFESFIALFYIRRMKDKRVRNTYDHDIQ